MSAGFVPQFTVHFHEQLRVVYVRICQARCRLLINQLSELGLQLLLLFLLFFLIKDLSLKSLLLAFCVRVILRLRQVVLLCCCQLEVLDLGKWHINLAVLQLKFEKHFRGINKAVRLEVTQDVRLLVEWLVLLVNQVAERSGCAVVCVQFGVHTLPVSLVDHVVKV